MSAARRWALLVVLGAGLLLITLDNSILYTALPTLTGELGADGTETLWIINAYPLVMAGLLLGSGTLGDRLGHRRMFLIGLGVFGAASLTAAFSPTPAALIAARALLAVGAAAMMPATLALIGVTFERERERNMAIAIWGSLSVVGFTLGPILGGLLLERFWWGSVFLLNVPVVVAALVATLIIAPPDRGDPSRRWDLISSAQAMFALVGAVVTVKEIVKADRSVPVVIVALLVTAVASLLFARRQRRLTYPLLDFAIFRNPALLSGVLAAAFSVFALGGVQLVTSQRFQFVAGFTPLQAGLLVAAVAAGTLPTTLIGGAILHRVGLRPLISGGLAAGVAGVAVTVLGLKAGLGWMITGLVLIGMGLGAAMSVASTAIIGNVPRRRMGMASSVEEVSYELGSLTAVTLLGSLLAAVYTATMVMPAGAPRSAGDGIGQALSAADPGDPAGVALIRAAASAFDTGYVVVMVVVAVVLVAGAAVTGVLLRHHGPGSTAATATAVVRSRPAPAGDH